MVPVPVNHPRKFFGKNGPRSSSGKRTYGRAMVTTDKDGKKLLGGKYLPDRVHEEAETVITNLIERDDINKIPGTPTGRRYARMHGLRAMTAPYSRNLFVKLAAETAQVPEHGFKSRDAAGPVKRTF